METVKFVLEFTFQSFWHWLGMFLLIGAASQFTVLKIKTKGDK